MAASRHEYIHGINAAFEVLRAGRRETKAAYLARSSRDNPRLKKLAEFCQRRGVVVEWVDKSRLVELSRSREHQGAVLKSRPYPYVRFETLLEAPRLLLLDNVEDPHNVGAILRSAEVFGFHDVLLPLKGTPEVYPSVVKVSAGASEHLHIAREMNANRYVDKLKQAGCAVLALDAAGETPLDALASVGLSRLLLVIGGEAKAVGKYILREATYRVRIQQRGRVNSLNASVAASIAMHRLDALLTEPAEGER